MGWGFPGLHFDLNPATLETLFTKLVRQRRCHLAQLGGDRAAFGVDNDHPRLVIGHAARVAQVRGRESFIQARQLHEQSRVCQHFAGAVGGFEIVFE